MLAANCTAVIATTTQHGPGEEEVTSNLQQERNQLNQGVQDLWAASATGLWDGKVLTLSIYPGKQTKPSCENMARTMPIYLFNPRSFQHMALPGCQQHLDVPSPLTVHTLPAELFHCKTPMHWFTRAVGSVHRANGIRSCWGFGMRLVMHIFNFHFFLQKLSLETFHHLRRELKDWFTFLCPQEFRILQSI